MLKKIILYSLLLGLPAISTADTVAVKPDHPESYQVQKGDTLWDISGKFLQHPWLWPQVWEANPQIENPHLIYPGDVVYLQYKDGTPILSVARAGKDKSGRYVKLAPTVRSYEKEQAIPTIPIDSIKQFLVRPLVVTDEHNQPIDLPRPLTIDQHTRNTDRGSMISEPTCESLHSFLHKHGFIHDYDQPSNH